MSLTRRQPINQKLNIRIRRSFRNVVAVVEQLQRSQAALETLEAQGQDTSAAFDAYHDAQRQVRQHMLELVDEMAAALAKGDDVKAMLNTGLVGLQMLAGQIKEDAAVARSVQHELAQYTTLIINLLVFLSDRRMLVEVLAQLPAEALLNIEQQVTEYRAGVEMPNGDDS